MHRAALDDFSAALALIDGERRPDALADLAIGRMRSKAGDLAMELEGRFGRHHALMCRLHLDRIKVLDDAVDEAAASKEGSSV